MTLLLEVVNVLTLALAVDTYCYPLVPDSDSSCSVLHIVNPEHADTIC